MRLHAKCRTLENLAQATLLMIFLFCNKQQYYTAWSQYPVVKKNIHLFLGGPKDIFPYLLLGNVSVRICILLSPLDSLKPTRNHTALILGRWVKGFRLRWIEMQ